MTKEEQIEQVYEQVRKEVGEIDVLLYNSGINQGSIPTHELDTKAALNVMNTNFMGAVYTCGLGGTFFSLPCRSSCF